MTSCADANAMFVKIYHTQMYRDRRFHTVLTLDDQIPAPFRRGVAPALAPAPIPLLLGVAAASAPNPPIRGVLAAAVCTIFAAFCLSMLHD